MTCMLPRLVPTVLGILVVCASPAPVRADESVEAPAAAPEPAPRPLGLTIDFGFASTYVFRGLNVFANSGQLDPHTMFDPGVTWAIPGTPLTVGYWGAFQLNGGNVGAKLDAAQGAEQDLFLNCDVPLPRGLTLSLGFTGYVYPAAKATVAGSGTPVFLEPRVGLLYQNVVDVSLNVLYFLGLQDKPAIRGASYLYLNPRLGKVLPLTSSIGLDLSLAYGFKYFINGNDGLGNVHDVLLKVGLPVRPRVGKLYLIPALAVAWTDIQGKGAVDGFAVVGSLNVGVSL